MDENLIIPDSTSIAKTIYDLNEFNNVVDTSFSELAVTTNPDDVNVQPDLNVDQFFVEYDNLYYQIPPTGSVQSHLELAGRSLEAVGISLDDLKNQIIVLSQTNLGTLA